METEFKYNETSRPVRARGLKLIKSRHFAGLDVAPRAGAWIET